MYFDCNTIIKGIPVLNCTHGDIRLESGRNDREGTVGVCVDGVWSTVCNSGWDSREAVVVCRQLGFPKSGTCSFTNKAFLVHCIIIGCHVVFM